MVPPLPAVLHVLSMAVFQASWVQMLLLWLHRCWRDSSNRSEQLAPDFKVNKHQNWVSSPCHLDIKVSSSRTSWVDKSHCPGHSTTFSWCLRKMLGRKVKMFQLPLGRGDFIAHESYSVKIRDSSKEPNTSLISSMSSISYGHDSYTSSLSLNSRLP